MCFLQCRISPMSFAILRIQKLKSFADIGGSLSHNYRNRETLNADSERTHLNEHAIDTNEKCMSAIRDRIPEKRRKDAVLCIEHLITASPEWDGWGNEKETAFFEQSKIWLEKKYGKKNVVSTTIHRDETTPHLVAYIVPLDEETGRLNAKKYIGGSRLTLSQMQTDFAVEVKDLGLDRGIQGSKAKHTSIREYYNDVNNYEPQPQVVLEKPEPNGIFESKAQYAERILESVIKQVEPKLKELSLLASQTRAAKKEAEAAIKNAEEARKALSDLQEQVKPYLDAQEGLDPSWKEYFDKTLKAAKEQVLERKKKIERQRQIEKETEEQRLYAETFKRDWNNTFARFTKEQIKNYEYQLECIREDYPDRFYREMKIDFLKRNLMSNPNYSLYIKNNFNKQSEQLAPKQNTEKRTENDYEPPSPF